MDECIFCSKRMRKHEHEGVDSSITYECDDCSFGTWLNYDGWVEEWDLKSANLIGWYKAETPLSSIGG